MGETQLSQDFKAAVARWLNTRGYDVKEVHSWDEYAYSGGGCDTCGPDTEIEVTIYFTNTDGVRQSYRHDGNFSYLLTDLLDA